MSKKQLLPKNLRVLVLETPYFSLRHSEIARSNIGALIGVRLNAYLQDYKEGVFPLGTEDFIAHHVAICIEDENKLTPVYSFKIMTMRNCEKFGLKNPLLSKIEDRYRGTKTLKMVEDFFIQRTELGAQMAYLGSRSKSIEIEWKKESSILLFNVGLMSLVKSCEYFGISEFCLLGMLNKDAYKYCEMMGMFKIIKDEIFVDSLSSSKAYILHKVNFSKEAQAVAKEFSHYWDQRIHVSEEKELDFLLEKKTA